MSNSLANNKLVRTLKELNKQNSNIFVGKKFRLEYTLDAEIFDGAYRVIVINHFITNTLLRVTVYRNELNDNNIISDENREYSSNGINGNYVVRDEFTLPNIKNTITNDERGTLPIYLSIIDFWYDSKKEEIITRINSFGSLESKAEMDLFKSLTQEQDPPGLGKIPNVMMYETYYRTETVSVANII